MTSPRSPGRIKGSTGIKSRNFFEEQDAGILAVGNTGLLVKIGILHYWEPRVLTEGTEIAGFKYSTSLLLLLCLAGGPYPSLLLGRWHGVRNGAGDTGCRCGCTKNPALHWCSLEITIYLIGLHWMGGAASLH